MARHRIKMALVDMDLDDTRRVYNKLQTRRYTPKL